MFIHRSTLRCSEHRATVEHYCDNCDTRIFPGDTYSVIVKVYVTLFHRWLYVRKEHEHPGCPYDPRDPDEIVDRNWKQDNELPLAA